MDKLPKDEAETAMKKAFSPPPRCFQCGTLISGRHWTVTDSSGGTPAVNLCGYECIETYAAGRG